jgi:hypothetical protein
MVVKMLEGHLHKIRMSKVYQGVRIYVFIEANYGGSWAVDVIKNIVDQDQFQPLEVVTYDTTNKGRHGIWMTDNVKECMAGVMQMSMSGGHLVFAKEFITATAPNAKTIQTTFREQCVNYRLELVKPLDEATGTSKKKYTGKTGSGRKDDLCICAQIALYFSGKKRLEPGFRALANQHGWRY